MKNLLLVLSLVSGVALANEAGAQKVPSKAELKKAEVKSVEYKVDSSSKLTWLGKKVGGEHTGNVKVKNGTMKFENKNFSGGDVEVDMTSITVTDITDADSNGKLVGHLKADDFFAVDKFPSAILKIKSAKKAKGNTYDVVADLTIKGITNEVKFQAEAVEGASDATMKAKVVFDRTKWKIEYKSGKIFPTLGDKIIYDDVEINVEFLAKK